MTRPCDNSAALGLGSSFLGYITHAGFIAGLEEGGVRPGHLAGSSAGAIAASLFAAGYDADRTRALLLDPLFRFKWFDWDFGLRFLATLIHLPGHVGMLTGRSMRRHLHKLLEENPVRPTDGIPRLSVAVTNLTTGRSEWKEEGDIATWVVASCAVPGLFQPVKVGDDFYADGGIADPVPSLNWAREDSIATVILHRIASPAGARRRSLNFGRAFARSHETITEKIFELQVQCLRDAGKNVIIARTETPRPSIFNTRRAGEHLWELGRATGRQLAAQLNPNDPGPEEPSTSAEKAP